MPGMNRKMIFACYGPPNKSPKLLWKARLLVRILKEREKRVATYITELKKILVKRTTPLAIPNQVL